MALPEVPPAPTRRAPGWWNLAPGLTNFIVLERTFAVRLAILLAAVAVGTGLRLLAGLSEAGVPFIFYFPVVIVVTLFAGWELGLAALGLTSGLAWYLFFPPTFGLSLTPLQTVTLSFFILAGGLQLVICALLRQSLRRANQSELRNRRLLDLGSGIVWTSDANGNILEPHKEWTNVTGMRWPDYAGRGWMKAIHPDDLDPIRSVQPFQSDALHEAEFRLWNDADGDWRWYAARAVQVPRDDGDGIMWISALTDIHDSKLARDRRDLVIGELRHRLKNLVTVIDALAKNSRQRGDPAVETFLHKFLGRLHALGAAGDLVLAGGRVAIECGALARATLAPFMEENSTRIRIEGPLLQLSEETGGSLGLAIHELATNALKYGALSVPGGRVALTWSVTRGEEEDEVAIEWKEAGGPRPGPPNEEGFGSRVIRSVCVRERNGEVDIKYEPDGLRCRFMFLKAPEGPPAAASEGAAR